MSAGGTVRGGTPTPPYNRYVRTPQCKHCLGKKIPPGGSKNVMCFAIVHVNLHEKRVFYKYKKHPVLYCCFNNIFPKGHKSARKRCFPFPPQKPKKLPLNAHLKIHPRVEKMLPDEAHLFHSTEPTILFQNDFTNRLSCPKKTPNKLTTS